jgi:NAD(P)-dependent dehydrogenase (short-subunit alcohol dehydrogenase family)
MTDLQHLPEGFRAAVIGASGGIGAAFTEALAAHPRVGVIHALSRSGRAPAGERIQPGHIDIEDEATIARAAEAVGDAGPLHLVFAATGLLHDDTLHPEKTWRDLTPDGFARAFAVNATGPALVAKHFLPLVPRREAAIFAAISARVGSVSDNRAGGWYGYRASKAALNQILRCLAIEEGRRRPQLVIAGLQPGTVATPLSEPFRSAVPAGELLDPETSASALLGVLAGLTPRQSGGLFDWQGERFEP